MEAIKISVEVSVNLSENTQNFIKSLFSSACNQVSSAPAQSKEIAPAEVEQPKKPSAPATAPAQTKPVAEPAQTKPVAEPAPSAPAAPAVSSASKSIEDVRGMLAKKVNDHRDAIKDKLTQLGAPSVTKLDPSKYDEMYNFLASL